MNETPEVLEGAFGRVRERIVGWLAADHWKIQEGGSPQTRWAVVAEDAQRKRIVFAQLVDRPDLLVIQGSLAVPEALRRRLDQMPAPEREELLWDMRFQLLSMDVRFQGVAPPLEKITVRQHLYVDDLRRNEFVGTVNRLQDALLAMIWMFRRKLQEPAPMESDDTLDVN